MTIQPMPDRARALRDKAMMELARARRDLALVPSAHAGVPAILAIIESEADVAGLPDAVHGFAVGAFVRHGEKIVWPVDRAEITTRWREDAEERELAGRLHGMIERTIMGCEIPPELLDVSQAVIDALDPALVERLKARVKAGLPAPSSAREEPAATPACGACGADIERIGVDWRLQPCGHGIASASPPPAASTPNPPVDLRLSLDLYVGPVAEYLERHYLLAALKVNEGRVQATADMARISRRTLLRKLRKHGINRRSWHG